MMYCKCVPRESQQEFYGASGSRKTQALLPKETCGTLLIILMLVEDNGLHGGAR